MKAKMKKGKKAWEGVFEIPIQERFSKPRTIGWTMVIDKGLGIGQVTDLIATASPYIDVIKLTFGTSAFFDYSLLKEKVRLITRAGVYCMPGGTFQEVAVWQGTFDKYLDRARELGFNVIEISDGTIEMDSGTRREVITKAVKAGFKVITEVGKKDPREALSMRTMAEEVEADLSLGAFMVIVEAREAGKGVGIYDTAGVPKDEAIEEILQGVKDPTRLMWEAPLPSQQRFLILKFGTNVNLGNVAPEDILALEALRCGLRGDTLKKAWMADKEFKARKGG